MIHSKSDVQSQNIGKGSMIWQYSIVLENAIIGKNCNINCHVFIENDVVIGDNVTVKSGVQLWDGITVEDNVFIGPNVTFTNDKNPRSKKYPEAFQQTVLKKSSSIGAGAILLGGITIGKYAMVGAGAIVTKSVPDFALTLGNPARIVAWLNKDGSKMEKLEDNTWVDNEGNHWIENSERLEKK